MEAQKLKMLCCTCPPSDLLDDEIEILNSGADLSLEEEALPEEEKLDIPKIQKELICIKSVIEKYQKKLKAYLDPCPTDPCVDYELELNVSKNKEIRALQRMQYKLECQINELVTCCKVAKQEFKNLRSLICEKAKDIFELQKQVAALESWRRTLELEAGLCIERFEYLKTVKAEWSSVVELLDKEKVCYTSAEKKLVPKDCYVKDKQYFMGEIKKLRKMFRELYELHNSKFMFYCSPDTPPNEQDFKFAETEYMALKKKYNDNKNVFEEAEKDDCEDI